MELRTKAVLGMYTTRDDVQFAVEAFRDAGFKNSDISVVLPEHMPVEELSLPTRKDWAGSYDDVEITAGGAHTLGTTRLAAALDRQEDNCLIVGPMAQELDGATRECAPEELETALATMGIPECDTGGYADKVLRGRALLSVHCDNAEMAVAARRLHGDLGGMDVFTVIRKALPLDGVLRRSMSFLDVKSAA